MSCACKIGGGPDGVCFECKSRRAFHARLAKLEEAKASEDYARGVADERARVIADLRTEARRLRAYTQELEAKLVERDVYEAQQILPPEQAALIKHLATVERCIEYGRTPHRPMTATEASLRLGNVRFETAGLESEIALRLKMDEINGTGLYPKPDLGIPDTAVAPPDDEDVP